MSGPIESDRNNWASEAAAEYLRKVRNGEIPDSEAGQKEDDDQDLTDEETKAILGDDFFGQPELNKMLNYLKRLRVPITSYWYNTLRPRRIDVEFAKKHNEIGIYLPRALSFDRISIRPTVDNIAGIFERIYNDDDDGIIPVRDDTWYRREDFATGAVDDTCGFLYLRRKPFNVEQLQQYKQELDSSSAESRRLFYPSVGEVLLTEMIYYSINQRIFFPSPVMTRTKTADKTAVYLAGFNARGFVLEKGASDQALYYPIRVR